MAESSNATQGVILTEGSDATEAEGPRTFAPAKPVPVPSLRIQFSSARPGSAGGLSCDIQALRLLHNIIGERMLKLHMHLSINREGT
jgi:hypothetical protein